MQKHRINHFLLLGVFLLSSIWSNAKNFNVIDGYNVIPIQEKKVESFPRGSSIQASIFTLSNGDEYYGEFTVTN